MCVSILEMRDTSAFIIKGDVRAFMMGERVEDTSAFMIKGDAPLATRASFAFIIGNAH
jgi:hypothetical protein